MISTSGSLRALADGFDEKELADLKRLLQMRVEELNQDQLGNLIGARQQLATRASELASSLAKARPVLRALDQHLTEMELAAQQAQRSESIRSALEGFEAIYKAMGSLSEIEQAVLQLVTDDRPNTAAAAPRGNGQLVESTARSAQDAAIETKAMPSEATVAAAPVRATPSANSDQTASPSLNVFDTALDRLRRTRTSGTSS